MKLIPVAKGSKCTMVDDDDYDKFKHLHLSLFPHGNNFYARTSVYDKKYYDEFKKSRVNHFLFHRIILGLTDPKISIDHIDGDGLNNQKSNLRICTHSQNMGNRKKNKNCSSRFKGVSFHYRDKIYMASIGFNGKRIHIGNYESEKEAALAYNVAASFAFREFAKLNVV